MSMFPVRIAIVMMLLAFSVLSGVARAKDVPEERIAQALKVLDKVMHAPDREMPQDMLRNAYAVAVIPSVIKAGLLLGGRHGNGLIAVKHGGQWSAPSFITMSGGSLGLQAGVSSTDVILIFRSEAGVDSIIHGKTILGTDVAVAAGPVGRSAQASTDTQMKAEIYAWSRSRGLFAGFALQGARLRIDYAANKQLYGVDVNAEMIFSDHLTQIPQAARRFSEQLQEYTAR